MEYSLGVDIGGTKIAAGIVDDQGNDLFRKELPSIQTDREAMFQQVVTCMKEVLHQSNLEVRDLKGIGIGVPGKVDCEKGIAHFQNNLPWSNFPISKRMKEHFPIQNVIIDNDVYMAAFAEWAIRGGDHRLTFVYLTVSTGVSCCIIHNGRLIRGAGFAGEIGFLPINEHNNRLEETASGPGLERAAYASQIDLKAAEILEGFKEKDPDIVQLMNQPLEALAKGVYTIECLLDPDLVILGGGVFNHNPELLEPMKKLLRPYLADHQVDFPNRLQLSRLGGDSGLIGAGLKVHSHFVKMSDGKLNL